MENKFVSGVGVGEESGVTFSTIINTSVCIT